VISETMLSAYSEEAEEETDANTSHGILNLNNNLHISDVTDLYTMINTDLGQSDLVLDAQHVERVDTASMQLLYATCKYAEQNDVNVNWQNVPEILHDSARTLGMAEALKLT